VWYIAVKIAHSYPVSSRSIPRRELRLAGTGALTDRILKNVERQVGEIPSDAGLRRRCIHAFAQRFGYDEPHARQVARLALQLFDGTKRLHRLGPRERELLEFAALLHDVGRSVSPSKHHKHSSYLIRHGALEAFAPEEISVIAVIARFHRGAIPRLSHEEIAELPSGARDAVIRLAAILRVADGLDRSHGQPVRNLVVLRGGGLTRIYVDAARGDAAMELGEASRNSKLWERVFDVRVEFKLRQAAG
jgi:exopolyphosphatase / guanosine-5'-triphosphate,3'-diphosphate pyrophosphatase